MDITVYIYIIYIYTYILYTYFMCITSLYVFV